MTTFLTHHGKIGHWLQEHGVTSFVILPDGTVSVDDDVDLSSKGLTYLPVRFGAVNGSFYCEANELTSLVGCPSIVHGNFNCSSNKLTSLEGGPEEVLGDYSCEYNSLTSLRHLPTKIARMLFCDQAPMLHLLNILQVTSMIRVVGLPAQICTIMNKHLVDRDLFACQQALIAEGFEEYATL